MASPTVIIDLSPVVRLHQKDDWRHVELVVKAWREQKDPTAVFLGVADNSLWYKMDEYGRRCLAEWKKAGRARALSWADPEILELATRYPEATVITTDLFRDHRRNFPWLQGTSRMVRPFIRQGEVVFEQLDFSPIPDHEVSWRVEEADLKPKGITTSEARQALIFEWSCTNSECAWGAAPVIDDDPAYRDGQVCCPECRTPARKAGAREDTRVMVVTVGTSEVDRVPIGEGTALCIGRGRGASRYDVRTVLSDAESPMVSRDHVRLTNDSGRLLIEDLGSRNGTSLISGDKEISLHPSSPHKLQPADKISLAGGVLQIRLSGRKRARGRYEPDLTTPPWMEERN